jgi:hypothetical protein
MELGYVERLRPLRYAQGAEDGPPFKWEVLNGQLDLLTLPRRCVPPVLVLSRMLTPQDRRYRVSRRRRRHLLIDERLRQGLAEHLSSLPLDIL